MNMPNYDQLHKALLANAEEFLGNAPDDALLTSLLTFTFEEPEAVRKRTDTDIIIICQFAALGITYLGKRRQELAAMEP